MVNRDSADGLFRCALIFSLAYFSYRYPLQINSSTTSPTYSDTPFVLQIGKYAVLSGLALWAFLSVCVRGSSGGLKAWDVISIVFFAVWLGLKTVFAPAMATFEFAFALAVPLIIVSATPSLNAKRLGRVFGITIVLGLLIDVVQIGLFFGTGRLPALAYENSLSVRFGSFMDDPNGFGAICFVLLGYAVYRYDGWTRVAAVAAVYFMLLATQSLTCLVFAAALACVYLGWRGLIKGDWRVWAALAVTVCAALLLWDELYATVEALILLKSGSIEQHGESVTLSYISGWTEWLFGTEMRLEGESWWVAALVNYGLAFVIGFFLFSARVCFVCWNQFRETDDRPTKACLFGVLLFQVFVTVSLLNLPFLRVFPVNFLFFVFSWIVLQRKLFPEPGHDHLKNAASESV